MFKTKAHLRAQSDHLFMEDVDVALLAEEFIDPALEMNKHQRVGKA
jgi:hypothetical protein